MNNLKVKVLLSKVYTIGGVSLEGEIEVDAPNVGTMIDAGELCPPHNTIGFAVAIVAVILKQPYNALRSMNPTELLSLQDDLKDILPN